MDVAVKPIAHSDPELQELEMTTQTMNEAVDNQAWLRCPPCCADNLHAVRGQFTTTVPLTTEDPPRGGNRMLFTWISLQILECRDCGHPFFREGQTSSPQLSGFWHWSTHSASVQQLVRSMAGSYLPANVAKLQREIKLAVDCGAHTLGRDRTACGRRGGLHRSPLSGLGLEEENRQAEWDPPRRRHPPSTNPPRHRKRSRPSDADPLGIRTRYSAPTFRQHATCALRVSQTGRPPQAASGGKTWRQFRRAAGGLLAKVKL